MSYARKVFVVGNMLGYCNWMEGVIVSDYREADIVVFTGGEDVSPHLYKSSVHPFTSFDANRDWRESAIFQKCYQEGKKMVGICRGAQFLCVKSGGILIQHQLNPRGEHPIQTSTGEEILVTSSHHQAQYPWSLPENKWTLLGWTVDESPIHLGGISEEMLIDVIPGSKEVEIAYYHDTYCLCIQGHPEIQFNKMRESEIHRKSITYHRGLLDRLLLGKL